MLIEQAIFRRSELLLGDEAMSRIGEKRVIIFGDPLARALRKRFKRDGQYPKRKFQCVYSDELLENKGQNATCGTEQCMCPKAQNGPSDPRLLNHEWCSSKAQINGTLAHITAIFGFMLAGLVIQDAVK